MMTNIRWHLEWIVAALCRQLEFFIQPIVNALRECYQESFKMKLLRFGCSFKKDFIYFSLEGKGGRKRGRERLMWESLSFVLTRDWTVSQACALTGNRTGGLSLCRMTPNSTEPHWSDAFWLFFTGYFKHSCGLTWG